MVNLKLDYLLKRFWEEADRDESFDLGELALMVVPALERRNSLMLEALKKIVNAKDEEITQAEYGTVTATTTVESIARFAKEALEALDI